MNDNWIDKILDTFKKNTKYNKIIVHDIKDIYSNPLIMELEEPYPYNLMVSNRNGNGLDSQSPIVLLEIIFEEDNVIKDKQYQIFSPSRKSDRSISLGLVIASWNIEILKTLRERYRNKLYSLFTTLYPIVFIFSYIFSDGFASFLLYCILLSAIYFPITTVLLSDTLSELASKYKYTNDIRKIKKEINSNIINNDSKLTNINYENQMKIFKLIKDCNYISSNLFCLGEENRTLQNELNNSLNMISNQLLTIKEGSYEKEKTIKQLMKCAENLTELLHMIENKETEDDKINFISQVIETIKRYNEILKHLKTELIQSAEIEDDEVKLKIIEQDAKMFSEYIKMN